MKLLFIYNPNSGKHLKEKKIKYIVNELHTICENVNMYATKDSLDAYNYIIKNGRLYNSIIVSGGDGTLNECISAIINKNLDVCVGYIPSGTTNDVARTLGIPLNTKKAISIIKKANHQEYDVMSVNKKTALYVCCFGMFTEVSYTTPQTMKKILKILAYAIKLLSIWFKQKSYHLEITTDNKKEDGYYACLFAVNSKYLSGFKINPEVNLSDGKVDVFYIKTKGPKIKLNDKFRLFNCYIKGFNNIKNNKYITKLNTDNISIKNIDNNNVIKYNIDGEYAFSGDATIKLNKKIKIFFNNDKKIKDNLQIK